MSWIQNLCNTYDVCSEVVGLGDDNGDLSRMLLPLYHTLKESNVTVWLSQDGSFISANKDKAKKNKDKVMICIPCTVESEARSSTGAWQYPHPLFDQLKYLCGNIYLKNLEQWLSYLASKAEHILAYNAINAIYRYIKKGTIKADLISWGIKPSDNLFLRFYVNIDGLNENRLWMMPEIWKAWTCYLWQMEMEKPKTKDVCYISGEEGSVIIYNHPKSINRIAGNAKLISGNDKTNFTFRGRFTEAHQAAVVSYISSQKAHQILRWLISKQSCYRCDSQAIIAWAIDSNTEVFDFYDDSYGIYKSNIKLDSDKLIEAESLTYIDYADMLRKAFIGYGNKERLKQHLRRIGILVTDAASVKSGRLAITYYRELRENEYLECLDFWHNTCKWYQPYKKKEKRINHESYFIGAPSIEGITLAVLGKEKSQNDKSYNKQKKILREQLIYCLFDSMKIPCNMALTALNRASNPFSYENKNVKSYHERWLDWELVLSATCALIKKFYHDYKKEEFSVELETKRKDRDYLYGRLLAIADNIEVSARYKQGKLKDDARATNAMRYMTAFSQHPFSTWNLLFTQQLNPYIQQLNGATRKLNIIGEITELFEAGQFEEDAPLDGRYLLGFFAQRQALLYKNSSMKKTEVNKDDSKEQD